MLLIAAVKFWSMREASNRPVFMEVECVLSQSQTVIKYRTSCVMTTLQV